MNNFTKLNRKNLIFTTVSLLMSYVSLFPQTQAATLYSLSSSVAPSSTEGFAQINQNFFVSNLLTIDSIDSQTFSSALTSEQAKKVFEMTLSLSQVDTVTRSALSFERVVNSLTELEFTFDKNRKLDVAIIPQVGFSDVYEGIYEFKPLNGPRSPVERLVGDYLGFDSNSVSFNELPRTYFYNKNSIAIGVAQAVSSGSPSEASIKNHLNQASKIITFPNVQEGLQLNRVKPEEQQLDSTLQLWPRNPLSTEVNAYGTGSGNNSQQLDQFGNLSFAVSFPLIPRNILLNQLDLEADWVNNGEYSNNLRENVEAISEQNRESQEAFQNRVEERRTTVYNSQQEYQRTIQNSISQSFQNSAYNQQRNQQVPGLSRYQTPQTNLNLTPRNLPSVPRTVQSIKSPTSDFSKPIQGTSNSPNQKSAIPSLSR